MRETVFHQYPRAEAMHNVNQAVQAGPIQAVPPPSPLSDQIDANQKMLVDVFGEVSVLEDRLGPILFPTPPEGDGHGTAPSQPVPVLARLYDQHEALRALAGRLRSLRERLAV